MKSAPTSASKQKIESRPRSISRLFLVSLSPSSCKPWTQLYTASALAATAARLPETNALASTPVDLIDSLLFQTHVEDRQSMDHAKPCKTYYIRRPRPEPWPGRRLGPPLVWTSSAAKLKAVATGPKLPAAPSKSCKPLKFFETGQSCQIRGCGKPSGCKTSGRGSFSCPKLLLLLPN